MTDNIIDLVGRLHARAEGQAKDSLDDFAKEHLQAAFRILAERHGLSDTWAAEKAKITHEIIAVLVRPIESTFTIALPTDLTDAEHDAVTAAAEEWANAFSARVMSHCLDALTGRLITLALP